MSRRFKGWAFVAAQAVLLVTLVVLPGRDDWPTSTATRTIGTLFLGAGFAAMGVATLTLGRSLTPTPVPAPHGQLTTAGLYRYVRHPIYTGVLAIAVGLTIRSGSWVSLAVTAGTIVFFNHKARWEEQQLAERYPGYDAYAASTPRFLPGTRRTSRRR